MLVTSVPWRLPRPRCLNPPLSTACDELSVAGSAVAVGTSVGLLNQELHSRGTQHPSDLSCQDLCLVQDLDPAVIATHAVSASRDWSSSPAVLCLRRCSHAFLHCSINDTQTKIVPEFATESTLQITHLRGSYYSTRCLVETCTTCCTTCTVRTAYSHGQRASSKLKPALKER